MNRIVPLEELLAAGDIERATATTLRQVGPAVRRFLRAVLRDVADADEAFARFGENMWRGLASFRGEVPLEHWALHIAWNVARDVRRDGWRRRKVALPSEDRLPEPVRTTRGRRDHEQAVLDHIREALSVEEQALLVLRLERRMEWAEIAEVLSTKGERVTPVSLRKRFERLRSKLLLLGRERGLID